MGSNCQSVCSCLSVSPHSSLSCSATHHHGLSASFSSSLLWLTFIFSPSFPLLCSSSIRTDEGVDKDGVRTSYFSHEQLMDRPYSSRTVLIWSVWLTECSLKTSYPLLKIWIFHSICYFYIYKKSSQFFRWTVERERAGSDDVQPWIQTHLNFNIKNKNSASPPGQSQFQLQQLLEFIGTSIVLMAGWT